MSVADHPGFLGFTSEGIIAIHADWPAYPLAHGASYALERLGQFPLGTRFSNIDDIDRCFLFRVGAARPGWDDFDRRLLHVALWHEDVFELSTNGWISGVTIASRRNAIIARRDELRHLELPDGTPVPLPSLDDIEDDVDVYGDTVPAISRDGIEMTPQGNRELERLMAERRSSIAPPLRSRVESLIGARIFDAAVREACVTLESELRASTQSDLYGQALIEQFCARLRHRLIESHVKWLRTELRACFSFVRNDFMHNLRDLTEAQCLALVCRVSTVYDQVVDARTAGNE